MDVFINIMKIHSTASPFHATFLVMQKLSNLLDQYYVFIDYSRT
ncbi:unnamed protein product [Spirodela intermedia]|uniref:Uncharacterized protein n=1 Tax=Spirodela intermedia TaxID=51605 RepID=A0A7I8KGR9_SPIIN|nr:unnamed protein product [Spirodela intermedia]